MVKRARPTQLIWHSLILLLFDAAPFFVQFLLRWGVFVAKVIKDPTSPRVSVLLSIFPYIFFLIAIVRVPKTTGVEKKSSALAVIGISPGVNSLNPKKLFGSFTFRSLVLRENVLGVSPLRPILSYGEIAFVVWSCFFLDSFFFSIYISVHRRHSYIDDYPEENDFWFDLEKNFVFSQVARQ